MTLLAASCQKGLLGGQREIIPVVSSTVMTKASSDQNDAEQLLFSVPLDADNGEEYTLEAWISDTPSNVPETKGTPVTTGNIQDVYRSFKTTAFCGGQPYSGLQEATVTYSNSEWAFDNVYYWPSDGSSLTFCSVAPVGTWNKQVSNLSWNNGTEATFTYTLPSPNGSSDAFNQDDLLIAMDTQSAGTSGEAEINFHHALTYVEFIVGSLKDVTINSISLKNFYGTGTCTYTPGSTPSFSWSSPSNKNTYVQDFGQKIESSTNDGYSIGDWSKTFMMIPQQLPPDAEIVITYNTDKTVSYKIGADNTTKDKSGNLINNWSPYAGKSITFKVNKWKPSCYDIILLVDCSRSMSQQYTWDLYNTSRSNYYWTPKEIIKYYKGFSSFLSKFQGNEKVKFSLAYFNGTTPYCDYGQTTGTKFKACKENSISLAGNSYIVFHLTSVTSSNYSDLKNYVDDKISSCSYDYSAAFCGLQECFWELYQYGQSGSKKIIVVVSDGVPAAKSTQNGLNDLKFWSSDPTEATNAANLTIDATNQYSFTLTNTNDYKNPIVTSTAKQIKDGYTYNGKTVKAEIYSILATAPSSTYKTENAINFMKAISSNCPNATSMSSMGTYNDNGYYYEIPSNGDLTGIFNTIYNQIME